jgi:CubicO group peptidase (beta-lactamase class C family)
MGIRRQSFMRIILVTFMGILLISEFSETAFARHRKQTKRSQALVIDNCLQQAKKADKTISEKLGLYMECHSRRSGFSGAVLVADDTSDISDVSKSIIFEKGYGTANRENGQLSVAEPTTKFLLGSITKQFVSALVLKYVSLGKIKLEDHVIDLLPKELLPSQKAVQTLRRVKGRIRIVMESALDPRWKDITVKDLLVHSSGIPDYVNSSRGVWGIALKLDWDTDTILKKMTAKRLQFKPGTSASYSNTNYMILGKILEYVAGQSWRQIVENEVSKTLLMKDTGIYDLKNIGAEYAGSQRDAANAIYRESEKFFAVGDMYSTVRDLFRWEHYLFSTDLIVPSSLRNIYLEQPVMREYSAGCEVKDDFIDTDNKGHQIVFKTGHLSGYANMVSYFPQDKLVVVVLSNVNEYPVKPLTAHLAGIVFNARPAASPLVGPMP